MPDAGRQHTHLQQLCPAVVVFRRGDGIIWHLATGCSWQLSVASRLQSVVSSHTLTLFVPCAPQTLPDLSQNSFLPKGSQGIPRDPKGSQGIPRDPKGSQDAIAWESPGPCALIEFGQSLPIKIYKHIMCMTIWSRPQWSAFDTIFAGATMSRAVWPSSETACRHSSQSGPNLKEERRWNEEIAVGQTWANWSNSLLIGIFNLTLNQTPCPHCNILQLLILSGVLCIHRVAETSARCLSSGAAERANSVQTPPFLEQMYVIIDRQNEGGDALWATWAWTFDAYVPTNSQPS